MSLRLWGVDLYVSVPFTVTLAFLLLCDQTGLMSASLFAVLFHEAGHFCMMKILRCEPKSVKLSASGILISGASFCTFKDNILIAASGPFVNLWLTVLLWLVGRATNSYYLLCLAAVQFVVGFVNLLPVKGLDGGTVFFNLLSKFKFRNAGLICSFISIFFACSVLVFGTYIAVINVNNPSLLLLGIYLIVINLMKR